LPWSKRTYVAASGDIKTEQIQFYISLDTYGDQSLQAINCIGSGTHSQTKTSKHKMDNPSEQKRFITEINHQSSDYLSLISSIYTNHCILLTKKCRLYITLWTSSLHASWWCSIVVRPPVLASKLSLSCARLTDGRVTTLWVKRPLSVNQHGQLSQPSLRGWLNE